MRVGPPGTLHGPPSVGPCQSSRVGRGCRTERLLLPPLNQLLLSLLFQLLLTQGLQAAAEDGGGPTGAGMQTVPAGEPASSAQGRSSAPLLPWPAEAGLLLEQAAAMLPLGQPLGVGLPLGSRPWRQGVGFGGTPPRTIACSAPPRADGWVASPS